MPDQTHGEPGPRTIRFGVMCNGTTLQEWEASCLRRLLAIDNVAVALVIINDQEGPRTWFDKIKQIPHQRLFFHLYRRYFIKPQACRPVDLSELFKHVPAMHCKIIKRGKFSQYFKDTDVRTIRAYKLDFILRFAFGIIRGEILDAARYGVWSFHHDDEEKYRGGPPCFWEIYTGDMISAAMLQRLTERLDAGIILKKGFFRTVNYSYTDTIDKIYNQSIYWPAQVCIDILNGNAAYIDDPPHPIKAPIYRDPDNIKTLLFIKKLFTNYIINKLHTWLRHDEWNIGIIHEPIHVFLNQGAQHNINYLQHPAKSGFYADPFGIINNGKLTILCETYDYISFKGRISALELLEMIDNKSNVSYYSETAIELPVHMSYPYVFQHEGEIYCVPETQQLHEVGLYKANDFPRSWTKITTLIEGFAGVDNTIFRHEGRWWLLGTDEEHYPFANLFAWYASDLLGPWHAHAGNPIKMDVRSSRPAGTPFFYNNCLYRPAQDCSRTYGEKIVLNRVVRLTPTEFKEEPTALINPDTKGSYPDGIHTLSAVGNVTLIDGKRVRFVASVFQHTLALALRRRLPWSSKHSGSMPKRLADD